MSFQTFKSNRNALTEKLAAEVQKLNQKNNFQDDRFWEPTVAKDGNGSAIIRFLPGKDGEDNCFVSYFRHSFKGPGGWYINNCPTTFQGQTCPCCDANSVLWNTEIKANRDIVSIRKRKKTYVSNILVVQDKANPDNEGKVFLYRYGVKIWEKISKAMTPDEGDVDDEGNPLEPIKVFDFWEGADFLIKIGQVAGYRSYDASKFLKPSVILKMKENDPKIEKIYNELFGLNEFVAANQFKSFSELQEMLNKKLGEATGSGEKTIEEAVAEKQGGKTTSGRKPGAAARKPKPEPEETDDAPFDGAQEEVSDETLAKFKALAEES